jgi:hypothetical protein
MLSCRAWVFGPNEHKSMAGIAAKARDPDMAPATQCSGDEGVRRRCCLCLEDEGYRHVDGVKARMNAWPRSCTYPTVSAQPGAVLVDELGVEGGSYRVWPRTGNRHEQNNTQARVGRNTCCPRLGSCICSSAVTRCWLPWDLHTSRQTHTQHAAACAKFRDHNRPPAPNLLYTYAALPTEERQSNLFTLSR